MGENLDVNDHFRIAILENGQEKIAKHFTVNRDDADKVGLTRVWKNCIAFLDGAVFQKLNVGNSFLYVAKVETIKKNKTLARPLTYFRREYESV